MEALPAKGAPGESAGGSRPVWNHDRLVRGLGVTLSGHRRPLVITYRGSDLNPLPQGAGWRARLRARGSLSQLASLRASRIVCVSRQLRGRLWWRREISVVMPSGVDAEMFRPEARDRRVGAWDGGKRERVVLFNAGHNPGVKRLDLARQAVALVQDLLDYVRLEVLDGGTRPDRMPDLLNAADCLLLTSDQEGSPTILQEALACNLPVVSVNAGDSAERLAGVRYSTIVAERDPQRLARVLRVPVRVIGRGEYANFPCTDRSGDIPVVSRSGDWGRAELRQRPRTCVAQRILSQFEWNTSRCWSGRRW